MPVVPFETLDTDARVWVFGSDRPLGAEQTELLLTTVDAYLAEWRAHGEPLTCARDWQYGRFLAVAVDQSDAYASGCSIDGMFRVLQQLQQQLGVSLLGGGRVFYRGPDGAIQSVARVDFSERDMPASTSVFDLTVPTVGEWRTGFERELRAASMTDRT